MRLVLLKSIKIANQAGYYLMGGRWHSIKQDQPAPKHAPQAAHPHAAGRPVKKDTLDADQWAQLQLSATNTNAGTFNKQLEQLKAAADSGDITGILGSGYGTNTYGKKLAIIANHVLEMLGSDHKVEPGQKPGTHAAVQTAPEIEAGEPAPKPKAESGPEVTEKQPEQPKAATEPVMPKFAEGKVSKGVKAHYEKVAKKVIRAAKGGDLSALQFMPSATGNTWKGKTDNSKTLLALHENAMEYAKTQKGAPAEITHPDAVKLAEKEEKELAKELAKERVTPEKKVEPKPEPAPAPKPAPKPEKPLKKFGWKAVDLAHAYSIDQLETMMKEVEKEHANPHEASGYTENGQPTINLYDKAGMKKLDALTWAITHKAQAEKKIAQSQPKPKQEEAAPKEGETKAGADGTLTFKNGRWHKADSAPEKQKPERRLVIRSKPKQVDENTDQPTNDKKPAINWDDQLLPDSNKNSKSHNGQVAKIKAMAEAGDIDGLKNFKAGTNTYGKKQNKLAAQALESLTAEQSTKNTAPAAEETPLSNDNPFPKMPDYEHPGYADVAKLWAKDAQSGSAKISLINSLENLADEYQKSPEKFTTEDSQKTVKFAISILNWLTNKPPVPAEPVVEPVPVRPSPVEGKPKDKKPEKPTGGLESLNNDIEEAFNNLEDDKLADIIDDTESMTSVDAVKETNDYAKAAYEYLIGKQYEPKNHHEENNNLFSDMEKPPEFKGKDDFIKWFWGGGFDKLEKSGINKYGSVSAWNSSPEVAHLDSLSEKYEGGNSGDDGPAEGETKDGADGTLTFHNGRWHKSVAADEHGEIPPVLVPSDGGPANQAAPSGPGEVEIPTFNGSNDSHNEILKNAAIALKNKAVTEGKMGLKGVLTNHKDGSVTLHISGMKLGHMAVTSKNPQFAAFAQFVDAIKASVGTTPKKKSAPKKKAESPVPAPEKTVESMDSWTQVGPQGGTNPGGKYKDQEGVEWYCKFPADEAVAKAEVLASKLYAAAGVSGQDAKLITKDGKVGIASRWQNVSAKTPQELAKTPGVLEGFATDAWLANWDVVGMDFDNLQVDEAGNAMRVDAGGSLMYRAQGSKKAFGDTVSELDSLRDKALNPQAAAVFDKMTKADITASVAKVVSISDATIRIIVNANGPGDKAERKALADTLIARKNDLLAKYPKAEKADKKRLNPKKLKVKEDRLPKMHDFANWNGPGVPLSSQSHVNEANQTVEQQMMDVAKSGNLVDLKDFKFQPIDKSTGMDTGEPKPISDHPSKHIVQLHSDLVQILDEIANPPQALKIFQETDVGTLEDLEAAFPPKKFGTTVNAVHSNEKMGFWVVLGGVAGITKFAPKKVMNFTQDAIQSAFAKFKEASTLAKHFVNSVQQSGSYNDLFRDGMAEDHQGNKLSDVAQAALEFATEQPEGTSIYRWQNMSDDMLKKLLLAPDGSLFQATGPMCTSYSPTATSGFGKHRVVIRYAQGAKAVESFGSGNFSGEKEITTLPNARFTILSKKMVPDSKNPSKQRMELELLMLPPDIGI